MFPRRRQPASPAAADYLRCSGPSSRQHAETWRCAELVIGQVELGEGGEVAQRLWQRAELVAGQVKLGEGGEVAQPVWQRAELVARQVKPGEGGEVAPRVWQRATSA